MLIYTGNKFAKFHVNIISLSENIAKSFRGWLYFFDSHYVRFSPASGGSLRLNALAGG